MKQVRLLLSLIMLLPVWAAAGWGAEGFPALTSDNEVTFFYVVDLPVTQQYANATNAHGDAVADASKLTYYLWWWGNGSTTDGYSWPGKPMTLESYTLNGKTVYKGTVPGNVPPSNFIISVYENDKLSNTVENNQEVARPIDGGTFANHAIYVNNTVWDYVTTPKSYIISVVNDANWSDMALYEYNEHDGFKTELFSGWAGNNNYTTATTEDNKIVYQFTFTSSVGVHSLIANNNGGGQQVNLASSVNGGFYTNNDGSQVTNPMGPANHIITLPVSESIGLGNEVIYQLNIDAFTTEGTIVAAQEQLDYLKNLGVDIIYLMPIHERGNSNSPYAVKDYYSVKNSYGTLTDLQAFVNAAHAKGMKVWLDWVANHTATEANWVTNNPDYYATSGGNKIHPNGYGDVWQLDLTKDAVQTAMIDAMKYWVANANIDGFRCDMVQGYGGYLPAAFWTKAISQLKTEKSTLRFLAETDFANHNGGAYFANGWNYDYAWNFQEQLAGKQNNHPVSAATLKGYCQTLTDTQGSDYGNLSRMVYLTSHDVNWNIDANTYGNVRRTIQEMYGNNRCVFTALEFTLYGMPLIFNGQERNVNEAIDYFGTTSGYQKVNWNNPNNAMSSLVKELVELKHTHPALNDYGTTKGSIRYIDAKNGDAANDNVLAYMREKGDDKVLVVLNLNGEAQTVDLIGINPGVWTQTLSGSYNYTIPASDDITLTTSTLNATVPANGYIIYTLKEATNYTEGWYLDCNVDWDSQRVDMTHSSVTLDRQTGKGELTYDMWTKSFTKSEAAYYLNDNGATTGTFRFKLREYYNSNGFFIKNPARVSAETTEGTAFTPDANRANVRWIADGEEGADQSTFSFNVSDDYDRYTISYYRSYGNDEFVEVKFETLGYASEGRSYTLNCYGEDGQQWATSKYIFTKSETPDEYGYSYSYVIKQEDFKNYGSADENLNEEFYFKIRPLENGQPMENHLGESNVFINAETEAGYTFTLPATDGEHPNEVMDAHWDSDTEEGKSFRLKWQPEMKEYIIKVKVEGGRTQVKVEFVKAYRYKGVDVTEELGEGKRIYLYNLGTGRFVYTGGEWGVQAVSRFEDYGVPFTIYKTPVGIKGTTAEDNFFTLKSPVDAAGAGGSEYLAINPRDHGASNETGLLKNGYIWTDQAEGQRWYFEKETDESITNGANVYRIYYSYVSDEGYVEWYNRFDNGDSEYRCLLYSDPVADGELMSNIHYRKLRVDGGTYGSRQYDAASSIPEKGSEEDRYYLWVLVTEDDLWNAFTEAAKGNRASADATYMMTNPAIVRNYYGDYNADNTRTSNGWIFDNTIVKPKETQYDNGSHTQFDYIEMDGNAYDQYGVPALWAMAYWNYMFGGSGEIKQTIEVPAITGWYSFKCNGMNVDPNSNAEMYVKINGTLYSETKKLAGNQESIGDLTVNNNGNTNLSNNERKQQELYLGAVAYKKPQYVNELLFYVSDADVAAATTNTAGKQVVTLEVGFSKPATDPQYAMASFDDVHISYLGEISFVMDEDYTEAISHDYIANEGHTNIEVYLKRQFVMNAWNTWVMPIDVDKKTLLQMLGQSVVVAQAVGLKTDDPNTIAFREIDYSTMNDDDIVIYSCKEANCKEENGAVKQALPYYIVMPKTNLGLAPRSSKIYDMQAHEHVNIVNGDGDNYYMSMGRKDMSQEDGEWYQPVWPWASYRDGRGLTTAQINHNNIRYNGSYLSREVPAGSYVMASRTVEDEVQTSIFHLQNAQVIKGFRFFIEDVDAETTGGAKLNFVLLPADFGNDDNDDHSGNDIEPIEIPGLTDGIYNVEAMKDSQGPVYSITGQKVSNGSASLRTLPAGIYVVNGHKVMVK